MVTKVLVILLMEDILHQSIGNLIHYPYDPCMVYLPTFPIQNQLNVGENTTHGSYGLFIVSLAIQPSTTVSEARKFDLTDLTFFTVGLI